MDSICRCCLIEHSSIYNIFEDGIAEKLLLCSDIKISEDDNLPKIVCEACLRRIEDSYAFRQTCIKSDEILRDWIGTLEETDCSHYKEGQVEILTEVEGENRIEQGDEVISDSSDENRDLNPIPQIGQIIDNEDNFNKENKILNLPASSENQIESGERYKSPEYDKCLEFCEEQTHENPDGTNHDLEQEEKAKVVEHLKVKRKSKMNCRICKVKFSSYCALKEHEITHTKNEIFNCEQCGKIFSRLIYLTRHLRRHTGLKKHQCSMCTARFYDSSSLKIHMRIHTGERPYECEQCKKRFVQHSQLKAHARIHSDEKPFECDICLKKFSHNTLLQTHKKTHLPEKKNICSICQKRFTLPGQLKAHMERHTIQETKYQCNECGKTFFHNTGLIYHMRTHSGERPYTCTVCSKSFLTKTHLCTHYRTHTKYKPPPKIKCPHCGKGCFSNSELRVHLRTHTGERPFECTICKKRFLLNVHLVVHMRTHTGEKPYPCSECGKSFASLSIRKKHMFRHTGEKNFHCDLCGKGFPQAGIRNTHRKVHCTKNKTNAIKEQEET